MYEQDESALTTAEIRKILSHEQIYGLGLENASDDYVRQIYEVMREHHLNHPESVPSNYREAAVQDNHQTMNGNFGPGSQGVGTTVSSSTSIEQPADVYPISEHSASQNSVTSGAQRVVQREAKASVQPTVRNVSSQSANDISGSNTAPLLQRTAPLGDETSVAKDANTLSGQTTQAQAKMNQATEKQKKKRKFLHDADTSKLQSDQGMAAGRQPRQPSTEGQRHVKVEADDIDNLIAQIQRTSNIDDVHRLVNDYMAWEEEDDPMTKAQIEALIDQHLKTSGKLAAANRRAWIAIVVAVVTLVVTGVGLCLMAYRLHLLG